MSVNKNKMTCQQANQIDLVDYLESLGFKPTKNKGSDYWFISPFRKEETASFKVHRRKNVWYDHGSGVGGSLIDFGLRYFNCQIPELLEKISSNFSFHTPLVKAPVKIEQKTESPIKILDVTIINSLDLLLYIKERKIDFSIANRYCKQVVFEVQNRSVKALGFVNDQGGYELRNSSFKGSTSPKSVSTFQNKNSELSVFEGFFDFLSYQMINRLEDPSSRDFLILNSTAFFEKNYPFMDSYSSVQLFLDHDPTGLKFTQQAVLRDPKFQDASSLYAGHKDLNEWMQSMGKAQVNSIRPKIR
jgi:CHC2 zinc finger/Toprim-like